MVFFEGKGGGPGVDAWGWWSGAGWKWSGGDRGKAGGGEKKGHKNCCFSPLTAAKRRFFFSLMKGVPTFFCQKKWEQKVGTELLLFFKYLFGLFPLFPLFPFFSVKYTE